MTNAFDTSGPSKFVKELERDAANSRKGSMMVEKLRAQGKEPMRIDLVGSDNVLRNYDLVYKKKKK